MSESNKLLRFTQWDNAGVVFVRADSIKGIRELPPKVYDDVFDDSPRKLGARTRLDTSYGDVILVTESADEIARMVEEYSKEATLCPSDP